MIYMNWSQAYSNICYRWNGLTEVNNKAYAIYQSIENRTWLSPDNYVQSVKKFNKLYDEFMKMFRDTTPFKFQYSVETPNYDDLLWEAVNHLFDPKYPDQQMQFIMAVKEVNSIECAMKLLIKIYKEGQCYYNYKKNCFICLNIYKKLENELQTDDKFKFFSQLGGSSIDKYLSEEITKLVGNLSEEEQYKLITEKMNPKNKLREFLIAKLAQRWTSDERKINVAYYLTEKKSLFELLDTIDNEIIYDLLLQGKCRERIFDYFSWSIKEPTTIKFLEYGFYLEIGSRLPKNQLLEFYKLYGKECSKSTLYELLERRKIPTGDIIEFLKLGILEDEEKIVELAKKIENDKLLEFFKLRLLTNEDRIAPLARRIPNKDLLAFFELRLLKKLENIEYVLRRYDIYDDLRLQDEQLISFFRLGLVTDESWIVKFARPNIESAKLLLKVLNSGLIKDPMTLANTINDWAYYIDEYPEEIHKFLKSGLINNFELVKETIESITDENLLKFIENTENLNLKSAYINAIRDESLRSNAQTKLDDLKRRIQQFENNEKLIADFRAFNESATPEQKAQMAGILKLSSTPQNNVEVSPKEQGND